MKFSKIIKPNSKDQNPLKFRPSVFLAGSIDMGGAENWQTKVENELDFYGITIFNPRRDDWNPDLKQDISEPEFAFQVNWELNHIEKADFVFIYFDPNGKAPITLMELGSCLGRKNIIVCCPEGYWRRGNVQVFCHREHWPLYDHIDDAIEALKEGIL